MTSGTQGSRERNKQRREPEARVFVPIEWLQPGMRADCDVYAGLTRLLAEGTIITAGMLLSLKSRNILQIEVRLGSTLAQAPGLPHGQQAALMQRERLWQDAEAIYEQHGIALAVNPRLINEATQLTRALFQQLRESGSFNPLELKPLAVEMVGQYLARRELPVKLLERQTPDAYLYRHGINSALLCLSIARDWTSDAEELEALVLAAMLHDSGLARLEDSLLLKPGPLDDSEWRQVRQHTHWGEQLARPALAEGPARSIIASHHERIDGRGYPDQLSGVTIDRLARLGAICDVYDALTANRSYQRRHNFSRAIDIIVHGAGSQFDTALVHQFIRRTGRFPVGTFVQLSSGAIGAVKQVNTDALWRPVVAVVLDSSGAELPPGLDLDLRLNEEQFIIGIIEEDA